MVHHLGLPVERYVCCACPDVLQVTSITPPGLEKQLHQNESMFLWSLMTTSRMSVCSESLFLSNGHPHPFPPYQPTCCPETLPGWSAPFVRQSGDHGSTCARAQSARRPHSNVTRIVHALWSEVARQHLLLTIKAPAPLQIDKPGCFYGSI